MDYLIEPLIIIAILFIFFFLLILLIRFILTIFFLNLIKKYKTLLNYIKSQKQKPDFNAYKNTANKTEEERSRDKKKEVKKIKEMGIAIKMNQIEDTFQEFLEEKSMEKTKIVGIAKPIGKWTSLILGQKVTGLMQQVTKLQQQNDLGYWANMMHSQRKSQSREKQR